jgi:hypothetical protein
MHKRALVFLQEMLRQALTKVQALEKVCADGLLTYFTKVYGIDSTGFGLPAILQDLFPGSGGSATKAGAKMQAVWDYTSRVFGHLALTPWHLPDNQDGATVGAGAHKGSLFLWDLGYFTVQALAHIAEAGAYFFSRLNHPTNIYETVAGRSTPIALASFLPTGQGNIMEKDIGMGAKAQGRGSAHRLPCCRDKCQGTAAKSPEERAEERRHALPSSPDSVRMASLYHDCPADHMEDGNSHQSVSGTLAKRHYL